MYTVATCPPCDLRYRIQPWPLPVGPRYARVVIDPPCGHRRFSILAVELDVFQNAPEWFPQTTQIVEIRPPDAHREMTKRRRRARPVVQFE